MTADSAPLEQPGAPDAGRKKSPRHRSPAYPGVSLEDAVERTGLVYKQAKTYSLKPDEIAQAWGVASATSVMSRLFCRIKA